MQPSCVGDVLCILQVIGFQKFWKSFQKPLFNWWNFFVHFGLRNHLHTSLLRFINEAYKYRKHTHTHTILTQRLLECTQAHPPTKGNARTQINKSTHSHTLAQIKRYCKSTQTHVQTQTEKGHEKEVYHPVWPTVHRSLCV